MNFEITKGFILFCSGIAGIILTIVYLLISIVKLKKANERLKHELDKYYGK